MFKIKILNMKEFINKHLYAIVFILPGILGGVIYWKYVGCASGTCPITSNWHTMVLFGALIGYLIGDSIDDFLRKRKNKRDDEVSGTNN